MQDNAGSELLYSVIESELRQKIISGEYPPGTKLPTEGQLCISHGVSRITVRHAIQKLVDDGLLSRYRGKGTFVRSPEISLPEDFSTTVGFAAFSKHSDKMCRRILEKRRLHASAEVAQRLNIPENNEVQMVVRLIEADGIPIAISEVYVSSEMVPHFLDDLTEGTELHVLLQDSYGIVFDHVHVRISAAVADKQQAGLLECMVGTPLLVTEKVVVDVNGRNVHYSKTQLVAERASHAFTVGKGGQTVEIEGEEPFGSKRS